MNDKMIYGYEEIKRIVEEIDKERDGFERGDDTPTPPDMDIDNSIPPFLQSHTIF